MENRIAELEQQVKDLIQGQVDLVKYYEEIAKQMVQGFKVYDAMFKVNK